MIKELSVKAVPHNRKAHVISAACLIIAALLFVTRFVITRFVGIVDVATVGFITASIFLYTKYISSNYYYETMISTDGEPLFIVKRLTGKRPTTLCRISFAEILSIKAESGEEFKNHKTPRGVAKYLYTPTLFPEKVYRINMRSAYERAEIVIECSDEFAALISAWAREARTNREDDE
jgi:hypothetical protein